VASLEIMKENIRLKNNLIMTFIRYKERKFKLLSPKKILNTCLIFGAMDGYTSKSLL